MDNTGSAAVNTFNVGDEINGGFGNDTLKITAASTSSIDLSSGSISNIENLLVIDINNSINNNVNVASNAFTKVTVQNLHNADVLNVVEGTELVAQAQAGTGTNGSWADFYTNGTNAASVTINDTYIGKASATSGGADFYHGDGTNGVMSAAKTIKATLNLTDANAMSSRSDWVDQYIYAGNTGNAGAVITTTTNVINATSDGSNNSGAYTYINRAAGSTVTSNINVTNSADVDVWIYANNNNASVDAAVDTLNVVLNGVTNESYSEVGGYDFEKVNITVNGAASIDDLSFYESDDTPTTQTVTIVANADLTVGTSDYNDTGSVSVLVTGSGNVNLGTYDGTRSTLSTTVTDKIDASGLTGKLTVEVAQNISSLKGGSGNDSITLDQALTAGHIIDGGAGVNSIKFANTTGAQSLADYALINATLVNFQKMEFTNAITLDASKLPAAYSTFTFDNNSTVTKVGSQALIAKSDLTATAADYDSTTTPVTYGATTLSVTETGDTKTLTLAASAATVNVTASTSNVASATVTGDIKTLTVNLTNAADAVTTPTGDNNASTSLTVVKGTTNNLAALTSVTLTGNGYASIDNSNATGSTHFAATKLATVDASALGGTVGFGANKGNITGGLSFTANDNVAETIKLGTGTDAISSGSSYGKMDTIYGFDAVQESATAGISTVDTLNFSSLTLDGSSANSDVEKMTVASSSTTLALAFVQAAATSNTDNKVVQFVFDGNTYLFADTTTNGALDSTDLAIKLVGTVDLTTAYATHVA